MATDIGRVLEKLREAIYTERFIAVCERVTDDLKAAPAAIAAVGPILKLMEEYGTIDFGAPGPLVHFVEGYCKHGYEEELLASLARRPTPHTLWMLNRLLNGSEGEARKKYLEVLDEILSRADLSTALLATAGKFRKLH
jgi:hypothetical protein